MPQENGRRGPDRCGNHVGCAPGSIQSPLPEAAGKQGFQGLLGRGTAGDSEQLTTWAGSQLFEVSQQQAHSALATRGCHTQKLRSASHVASRLEQCWTEWSQTRNPPRQSVLEKGEQVAAQGPLCGSAPGRWEPRSLDLDDMAGKPGRLKNLNEAAPRPPTSSAPPTSELRPAGELVAPHVGDLLSGACGWVHARLVQREVRV
jgi:hypothetical protein